MAKRARIVVTDGPLATYSGQQATGGRSWNRLLEFTDGTSEWVRVATDDGPALSPGVARIPLALLLADLADKIAGHGNYTLEVEDV